MARINLLPWRDKRREENRKRFLATLAACAAGSVTAAFFCGQYIDALRDQQEARNELLRTELAVLDERIKEIRDLRVKRTQLLERIKIIRDLQGNRPLIGHLFDQFARTLPDGVYFSALSMKGEVISVTGQAETNGHVSDLMRNMDASRWLTAPALTEVRALSRDGSDQSGKFELSVRQSSPLVSPEIAK